MTGTVKWFNLKEGYGFIRGDDGQEYFLHRMNAPPVPQAGDKVEFQAQPDERGPRAVSVALIVQG